MTEKKNSNIIVKPYSVHSVNASNIESLCHDTDNIDVQSIDEFLSVKGCEKESELTSLQQENFQGNR